MMRVSMTTVLLAAVLLVGAAGQAAAQPCPVTITMGGPGSDQSYELNTGAVLQVDADGSGSVSPGDTLRYTVQPGQEDGGPIDGLRGRRAHLRGVGSPAPMRRMRRGSRRGTW